MTLIRKLWRGLASLVRSRSSSSAEREDEEADDDDEYFDDVDDSPIGDELDLHTFRPRDVSSLVPDYIDECLKLGHRNVRIIHGKGKGTLRRIVHSALERHPGVVSFELGGAGGGSWGATRAVLDVEVVGEVGEEE